MQSTQAAIQRSLSSTQTIRSSTSIASIGRARRIGRTVPLAYMAEAYVNVPKPVRILKWEFGSDLSLLVTDNTGEPGNAEKHNDIARAVETTGRYPVNDCLSRMDHELTRINREDPIPDPTSSSGSKNPVAQSLRTLARCLQRNWKLSPSRCVRINVHNVADMKATERTTRRLGKSNRRHRGNQTPRSTTSTAFAKLRGANFANFASMPLHRQNLPPLNRISHRKEIHHGPQRIRHAGTPPSKTPATVHPHHPQSHYPRQHPVQLQVPL